MAEIDIERKRGPRWWPWLLAVLLLVVVGATAWYITGPGSQVGTEPDLDAPANFGPGTGTGSQAPQGAPPGTNPPESQPPVVVP